MSTAGSASSRPPTCHRARSTSGSAGPASTSRTAWRRAPTARSPGSARSSRVSTWPARSSRPRDPSLAVGTPVLAHGYDLGVSRHGGYSEYQRVPAGWVVPLAPGLTARDAMAIGTAGFTAAMSVVALEERGLTPDDGPVLVTGASGGVGGTALAILAERGYEVWAVTGKPDEHERLTGLGAAGFLTRDEVAGAGQAARVGAMGRGGRRGRRGDPAVRPAHAADRRDRGRQRQRRRAEARDDGLPVHPARRRAARDGLGHRADRPAPRASGTAWRRTCARAHSASTATRSRSTRSRRRSTASSPGPREVAGSSASAADRRSAARGCRSMISRWSRPSCRSSRPDPGRSATRPPSAPRCTGRW